MTASRDPIAALRLERLHQSVAVDLLSYFSRRTESPEDAAELLSDTLLVAWRRIDRLPKDDEGARMWMFVTARGVLSNWQRWRRRHVALSTALSEQLRTSDQARYSGGGGDPANGDDVAREVRAAVKSLPRSQKELVMLVHWDGFSVVDAATVLGISLSTARGRYQRAVIRLRRELEPSEISAPQARRTVQLGES